MTGAGSTSALEHLRAQEAQQEEEEHGSCPWCGEFGVGLADSEIPGDYCGHDPALVRRKPK